MHIKALKIAILGAFVATSIACGQIEVPMTLALDAEASSIELTIPAGAPEPTADIGLEGGVETLMVAEISLIDLLFSQAVLGTIEVTDLLFGGTPFNILGISTEEVCVVVDDNAAGGGTVLIDIFQGHIDFNMTLATAILIGNPILGGVIPDGFPFEISVMEGADLSLVEMLALLGGNTDGGLAIEQNFSEVIEADIGGLIVPIGVNASISLATANEFPSGMLIDDCIAFLAE